MIFTFSYEQGYQQGARREGAGQSFFTKVSIEPM